MTRRRFRYTSAATRACLNFCANTRNELASSSRRSEQQKERAAEASCLLIKVVVVVYLGR